jgi:hypothetical protein
MKKFRTEMKIIDINVILTFCSYKEHGSQEVFDISLIYDKEDKSAKQMLNQSGFFGAIAKKCEECGRLPSDLVKISTAANWTKNGFAFDIGGGKWSFGSWRGQNVAWSDSLAKLYGFGKNDDSAEDDLNLRALRGIFSAKVTNEAIRKAMSK